MGRTRLTVLDLVSFKPFVNRIQAPHGSIDLIQGWHKSLVLDHIWVLVRHPTCIYGWHEYVSQRIMLPSRPGHHIQCCLSHICVRMKRLLVLSIENTLHCRNIHDKPRILSLIVPLHQRLELRDEDKRCKHIDLEHLMNLVQRDLLELLLPSVRGVDVDQFSIQGIFDSEVVVFANIIVILFSGKG